MSRRIILNLRGTHGSGKSTIIKQLLDKYGAVEDQGAGKHPLGYHFNIPWLDKRVHVVGSYRTACGGCDGIQPYSEIWPRIERYAQYGHVLFEGALVSSSYGNIGRSSEVYGDDFIFAFMDTPLEVCLDRIIKRRLVRGNTKPLDPGNTEHKYNSILGSIPKIRDEFGRRVVMVDHRKALSQVLGLLKDG